MQGEITVELSSNETSKKAAETFRAEARVRRFSPRQTLIYAGDKADSLFLLFEGSVAVMVEDPDGREMVLAYLNPGDFFGEMGLFRDEGSRSAWVVARSNCVVGEMGYGRFRTLVKEHPHVLFEVSTQLSNRLASTSRKVRDLAFLDVTGRIARALLDLTRQPDAISVTGGRQIKISRQEIARLVGCSREMASRVLKSLEEQGLIGSEGRQIIVFDHAIEAAELDD